MVNLKQLLIIGRFYTALFSALEPTNCAFVVCGSEWLKCCFTSTETVGLLGTGAQNGYLDFHTAPELKLGISDWSLLLRTLDVEPHLAVLTNTHTHTHTHTHLSLIHI